MSNKKNSQEFEQIKGQQQGLAADEQEIFEFAKQVAEQAGKEQEQELPQWNRASAFEQCFQSSDESEAMTQTSWWQWRGIPALSMACSMAAIALVLMFSKPDFLQKNSELDQQMLAALIEEQVNRRVAEQLAQEVNTQVNTLVSLRLREFAAEQQVILANYRADMSSNQQSNNLQLASYILGASRQERKEDLGDFIGFINAQRKDEQLSQNIKFEQLQREISFQKINYQQSGKATENTSPLGMKNNGGNSSLQQEEPLKQS